MTTPGEAEPERLAAASGSEIPATSSMALSAVGKSSLGDIWDNWNGDFSFLDGTAGDGSEKKPYQIKNKNQLMALPSLPQWECGYSRGRETKKLSALMTVSISG